MPIDPLDGLIRGFSGRGKSQRFGVLTDLDLAFPYLSGGLSHGAVAPLAFEIALGAIFLLIHLYGVRMNNLRDVECREKSTTICLKIFDRSFIGNGRDL